MRFNAPRLAGLLRSLVVRSGEATFRFPAAALAILTIAAIANWVVATDLEAADTVSRWLLGLVAGAAASVALTLWSESRGVSGLAARVAGFGGLAIVGTIVAYAHPFLLHGPR